jgi:hypothetical protein
MPDIVNITVVTQGGPLATTTRAGRVKISEASADPVVPTVAAMEAAIAAAGLGGDGEGSNFRLKLRADVLIPQLKDPVTGLWFDLTITTVEGVRAVTLVDDGEEQEEP